MLREREERRDAQTQTMACMGGSREMRQLVDEAKDGYHSEPAKPPVHGHFAKKPV